MEEQAPINPQEEMRSKINALPEEALKIQPFYYDLRNEIVKPHRFVMQTRYFWEKWKPHLGPYGTLLVMELRSRCYNNQKTGEMRDQCSISIERLSKAIGISSSTVKRTLRNSHVKLFVKKRYQWKYDPAIGKKVQDTNIYQIAMDDPLVEADEILLRTRIVEKCIINSNLSGICSPAGLSDPQVSPPAGLSDLLVPGPAGQRDPHIYEGLSDPPIISTSRNSLKSVNVLNAFKKNEKNHTIADMVTKLEKNLGDNKSRGWFYKISRAFYLSDGHCDVVNAALQDVMDQARSGRIRKNRGAAFTDLIKRYAIQYGVDLM